MNESMTVRGETDDQPEALSSESGRTLLGEEA